MSFADGDRVGSVHVGEPLSVLHGGAELRRGERAVHRDVARKPQLADAVRTGSGEQLYRLVVAVPDQVGRLLDEAEMLAIAPSFKELRRGDISAAVDDEHQFRSHATSCRGENVGCRPHRRHKQRLKRR
jgi:hypothetical protein